MSVGSEKLPAGVTRRDLFKITGGGLVGAAALSFFGCSPSKSSTNVQADATKAGLAAKSGSQTMDADIVVVGMGASGILAAYGAAKKGAKVVAIDVASDMTGTTNTRTSAPFAVGAAIQAASPEPLTIKEAMDYYNNGVNYQMNNKAMRNILEASGRAVDIFQQNGMEFNVDFSTIDSKSPIPLRGDCWYKTAGADRAAVFTKMMDSAGVETRFGSEATGIILDNGKVAGVQATINGAVTDIKAKSVIICTGGFLGNADKVSERFAGSKIVCMGNAMNKGAGQDMAIAAGAQIGKCFSISMNEYGGANANGTPTYSFRPTTGSNEAMRLPVFGGLLVDAQGDRFLNEGFMCEKTMFAAEPIVREGYHYAVCDEVFMKRWESEPLPTFLGDARMKKMFDGVTASDIRSQFDKAVNEGWAYKADSLKDLAAHFGLIHLEDTVASYNKMCAAGSDTEFFKDSKYLWTVSSGPYYVVQSQPAGWLSLGGIKTDRYGQALDANNKAIDNLYIAGADADLFSSPYYGTGTANGFAIGSGLLAGERAVAML